ncbi:hypothetical protein [[Eubacterium] cellulosolvens]
MDNSLKKGAISGLIAGIVWGIADILFNLGKFNAGIVVWFLEPPPVTPLIEIVLPAIIFNSIFGVIFGIIFSKIYNLIPGKTLALKGLLYGLALYFFIWIRYTIFVYLYGYSITSTVIAVTPIIYGLILGILYKAPIQKLETKHDVKDGLIPGALTGLIFGIVVIITFIASAYLEVIFSFMEKIPDYVTDIGFIINQYGSHTVVNIFLMAFYGAVYVRFYDIIPGKALIKGALFGFIIWLIIDFYISLFWLMYGWLSISLQTGLLFPDTYVAVGILIEGFYNRRWKAFPIAAVIFLFSIIKYFILTPWLG